MNIRFLKKKSYKVRVLEQTVHPVIIKPVDCQIGTRKSVINAVVALDVRTQGQVLEVFILNHILQPRVSLLYRTNFVTYQILQSVRWILPPELVRPFQSRDNFGTEVGPVNQPLEVVGENRSEVTTNVASLWVVNQLAQLPNTEVQWKSRVIQLTVQVGTVLLTIQCLGSVRTNNVTIVNQGANCGRHRGGVEWSGEIKRLNAVHVFCV